MKNRSAHTRNIRQKRQAMFTSAGVQVRARQHGQNAHLLRHSVSVHNGIKRRKRLVRH